MSDRSTSYLPVVAVILRRQPQRPPLLDDLVDAVTAVRQPAGQPRERPAKLHAHKAYNQHRCGRSLRRHGIRARIARKGIESSTRLGRHRNVIERTLEWLTRVRCTLRSIAAADTGPLPAREARFHDR